MANWKSKVEIGDLLGKYRDDNLTAAGFGNELAKRLEQTQFANDPELQAIIHNFRHVGDEDDVDEALEELYNFGDTNHRIWVNTFQDRNQSIPFKGDT